MPKLRSLLRNPEVRRAGKLRRCAFNKSHTIPKGDLVLEVAVEPGKKGYCATCGSKMIAQAIGELRELQDELGGSKE